MRESQSKKVEKYRNATAENAAKNLGSSFFSNNFFLLLISKIWREMLCCNGWWNQNYTGNFFGGKSTQIKLPKKAAKYFDLIWKNYK